MLLTIIKLLGQSLKLNACYYGCRLNIHFFSVGINGVVAPPFLAFFAARFSFKVMAGFFIASRLLFRSFDMVILRIGMSDMSI